MDKSLLKVAKRLVRRYSITKAKHIIEGGKTRTESVERGLRCVDKDTSLVLIHDGVRPFVSKEIVKKTIAAALKFGASVSAVPVKATIKVSGKDSFVKYTPARENLWEIQTPQVFKRILIEEAYKKVKSNRRFTDDATLIENIGKKVKIVKGDDRNIKITTTEDIKIAEALFKNIRAQGHKSTSN
jgi:2-C-methyl-D-erythritol 4-phosphate cytidylyltransferase